MAIVPRDDQGIIDFYSNHKTPWNANAAAIGLTAAQIADLTAKIAAAEIKLAAAQAARQASKAATVALNDAMRDLKATGSPMIAAIKAKAESNVDPATVYWLAEIPPPTPPTPRTAPPPPENLNAVVTSRGKVTLSWQGTIAHGTFYNVYRRLAGSSQFTLLTAVGARGYEDSSIPAGTDAVTYYLTAQRGDKVSEDSSEINVVFGAAQQTATLELKAA